MEQLFQKKHKFFKNALEIEKLARKDSESCIYKAKKVNYHAPKGTW